jgi:hypothetical protein
MMVLLGSVLLCGQGVAAKQMSIQIKQAQLRAQPSPLGRIEATAVYGDRVDLLEEQTDWVLVGIPGSSLKGWVHKSALSTKKLALQTGSASTGASADEIVLAGKGFNAQVEEQYKQANQELNYARIDQMEREFIVSPLAIQQFLEEGGLQAEGGTL